MQQPPHVTHPPKKSSTLKVVFIVVGLWGALIFMFLVIWQFLAPEERRDNVAYSDFLTDVQAGRVDEIRVKGRDIDYRFKSTTGTRARHTTGPVPDQAFLDTLKPADSAMPPPKVIFDK